MQTIILDQPGHFRLTDTPEPGEVPAGSALVRVHRVGICGTDIHAFYGRQPFFTYPRILGHELGVEVVAVGEGVTEVTVGQRCSVEPYLNCGTCIACRRGRPNCCTTLQTLGVHTDGGMREYITIPARKLHTSDRLSYEQLALVETLGIGAHAVTRAQIQPGETALIVGVGPIGLSAAQFAHVAGAHVIVTDVSVARLEFCRSLGTANETVVADEQALTRIKELAGGDLPTVVFDATGNRQSMQNSFSLTANSGRLVFVGLLQGDITFNDPEFHRRELTLLASRNAPPEEFPRIINLIETGQIDTSPWITNRASCMDLVEVFPAWMQPGSGLLKGIVEFA